MEIDPQLSKPGRVWGDRTMTVQYWPGAEEGDIVEDSGKRYRVVMNVRTSPKSDQYVSRWAIFVREEAPEERIETPLPYYT
jgi:hypothetical protein